MTNKSTSKKTRFSPDFNYREGPSWLWILLLFLLLYYMIQFLTPNKQPDHLSYTAFKQAVEKNQVVEVTFQDNQVFGRYRASQSDKKTAGKEKNSESQISLQTFQTLKPDLQDPNLLPLLEGHNVVIHAEAKQGGWLGPLLIGLLPWVFIIGLMIYSSRRMQQQMGQGAGKLFGFGKSKAKQITAEEVNVTYEDVVGLTNTKKELREIVLYLKNPERFEALGAELPKGILLVGPPGVGKTLMARATAGEAGVVFFSISGSDFIEMFVGVGASRVRDLFERAKKNAPAIIFVDELDSIGRIRGTGVGGGHDEREQTLNQILNQMDGFFTEFKAVRSMEAVGHCPRCAARSNRAFLHRVPL